MCESTRPEAHGRWPPGPGTRRAERPTCVARTGLRGGTRDVFRGRERASGPATGVRSTSWRWHRPDRRRGPAGVGHLPQGSGNRPVAVGYPPRGRAHVSRYRDIFVRFESRASPSPPFDLLPPPKIEGNPCGAEYPTANYPHPTAPAAGKRHSYTDNKELWRHTRSVTPNEAKKGGPTAACNGADSDRGVADGGWRSTEGGGGGGGDDRGGSGRRRRSDSTASEDAQQGQGQHSRWAPLGTGLGAPLGGVGIGGRGGGVMVRLPDRPGATRPHVSRRALSGWTAGSCGGGPSPRRTPPRTGRRQSSVWRPIPRPSTTYTRWRLYGQRTRSRPLLRATGGGGGWDDPPPPNPHQKIFPREKKKKYIKGARTLRSILGTHTFFWTSDHPPPPPRDSISQPVSKGVTQR